MSKNTYLERYNDGNNDGDIIFVCNDGKIYADSLIIKITCDLPEYLPILDKVNDKPKGKKIDEDSEEDDEEEEEEEHDKPNGKKITDAEFNILLNDKSKRIIDMRKYPSRSVNIAITKCYWPDFKYPNDITFNNILDIIEINEYIMTKNNYANDLIKKYISKINKDTWRIALKRVDRQISSNDFGGKHTMKTRVYHQIARNIKKYVTMYNYKDVMNFTNELKSKYIDTTHFLMLVSNYNLRN